MKDLYELHHSFGMHVQVQLMGVGLLSSQHQYMLEILDRAGMTDCKPCSSRVDINPKLSVDGLPVSDPMDFHSLAGALQYLTFTRHTSLMQFSRFAYICMILENHILQL
jgi:hypothetical protein